MNLQTVNHDPNEDKIILNHTRTGSLIQELAEANIEIPLTAWECGFLDGGCYLFAKAMQKAMCSGSLVTITRPDCHDHVALKCGDFYIDANGMATFEDIITVMRATELFGYDGEIIMLDYVLPEYEYNTDLKDILANELLPVRAMFDQEFGSASKETKVLVGQCDRIRATPQGEVFWQDLMHNPDRINQAEFMFHCDPSAILDDRESIDQFMEDSSGGAGYYRSIVAGRECFFLQHSGFEFVFADEDIKLHLTGTGLEMA